MIVILLGPQGSGKGTQAQLLVERKGFVHLEMGRILRSVGESENQYSKTVRETLAAGELVPDEYVRLIAWDFVTKHGPKSASFLFEGYPRTVAQYEQVQEMLRKFGRSIDAVVNIEISDDETIKRLTNRRTCNKCGEVYNLVTNPPQEIGKCDKCGGDLVQRNDDKEEPIKKRLAIYRRETQLVFERARSEGIGIEIDGEQPIEEIYKEITKRLKV